MMVQILVCLRTVKFSWHGEPSDIKNVVISGFTLYLKANDDEGQPPSSLPPHHPPMLPHHHTQRQASKRTHSQSSSSTVTAFFNFFSNRSSGFTSSVCTGWFGGAGQAKLEARGRQKPTNNWAPPSPPSSSPPPRFAELTLWNNELRSKPTFGPDLNTFFWHYHLSRFLKS